MGMFDSVYVDKSMAQYFPLKDGALPEYDREWQTKDLDCNLDTLVLKDLRVFARWNDELRPWPIHATFVMYTHNLDSYELEGEYEVSVINGFVQSVDAPRKRFCAHDSHPFAEEMAEAYRVGMERTLAMLEEMARTTPTWVKIKRKLGRIGRAVKAVFRAFGEVWRVFRSPL